MANIFIERALYRRERSDRPRLLARSLGVTDAILVALPDLLIAFGERPFGVPCPGAIFARPVEETHVAIVQVDDVAEASLQYSVMVLTRLDYEALGGDPVELALRVPAAAMVKRELDAITLPAEPLAKRGIEQVRAVLQRQKRVSSAGSVSAADETTLTIENSESPTLLGGVQALVDGGRLAFERPGPDASLISALWTLLPNRLRPRLWPATFAFSNALAFDVVVLPRLESAALEGYTSEEQATDYPEGNYELSLQIIAESGDEATLGAVFAADAKAFEPSPERRARDDAKRLWAISPIGPRRSPASSASAIPGRRSTWSIAAIASF
jgi:hypothetical protein